jgi:uncharacterized iron-regulated protein
MKTVAFAATLVAFLLVPVAARTADSADQLHIGDPARRDRKVAVVLDGITDAARGDTIGPSELAARLDGVRLAFVGESHIQMDFHVVQLRVLQELVKRGRKVMVGLEMYPVPEQKWLDRWYGDRKMTEEKFLAESHWYRNWGYHWNYYRDIFLFAREHHVPMFAVNLPRAAVTTIRLKGFDSLSTEMRAMLPPSVDLTNEEHRKLFRAFFGDSDALHSNMPPAMFETMYRAQCGWDAAMGWNALQALETSPDTSTIMLVCIGQGHVAYGLGAERQAKRWFGGRTASIIPVPVADAPGESRVERVQASYADFVWGLPVSSDPLYPSTGISTPETKSGEHYKVLNVASDSPAAAAGIKTGDELVSIDGLVIADKEVVQRYMSGKRWGDDVVYRVLRGGQELTLTLHLRRQPPASAAADSAGSGTHGSATPAPGTAPGMPGGAR